MGGMTRRRIGEREDRENRPGMRPRREPVFGYLCAACPEDASTVEEASSHGWLIGAVVLAAVLLLAYLIAQAL